MWLDLHWEELEERVIALHRTGKPITINGQTISIDDIEQLRITETEMDSSQLRPVVEQELRSSHVSTSVPIDSYIASQGRDVTNILITAPPGNDTMSIALETGNRPAANNRTVFVVHGRNAAARDAVFEFLSAVDLRPLEWAEAVQLTKNPLPTIPEILDAAFSHAHAVVVFYTPDDVAMLQEQYWRDNEPESETQPMGQARPNVLFESGMAIGRYPTRTVLVQLGTLRPFSDISGIYITRLDDTPERRQEFAQKLEMAGCPVNRQGIRWFSAGRFSDVLASISNGPTFSVSNAESQQGLSDEAKSLLIEAIKDNSRSILRIRVMGGLEISTNGKEFPEMGNGRSEALWEQVLLELVGLGLIQDISGKGEIFQVTYAGFESADALSASD